MTLTPASRRLLRDVAAVIIDSGYARPRPYAARGTRITQARRIAAEYDRLPRWNSDLVCSVAYRFSVDRRTASRLICRARKMRR